MATEAAGCGASNELSAKEAYFASLSAWSQLVKAAQMFPIYMILSYNYSYNCPQFSRRVARPVPVRPQFNPFRLLEDVEQRELVRRFDSRRMLTAPFWKRTIAEFVDALIIFVLKLLAAIIFYRIFNVEFDKSFVSKTMNKESPFLTIFLVSLDILSLSFDMIALILLAKLIVCLYECLWITYNNGATPGKALMQIRVLYVEAVVPLSVQVAPQFIFQSRRMQIWSVVYPAETPSFMRSLFRSFIKNMVLSVFLPVCVLIMFVKNNRTTYDFLTKTVVVEVNPKLYRQTSQEHPHLH